MSEKKNTPVDPLAPEIPEKAKVPETPTSRVEHQLQKAQDKVIEYKKDVKFLWLYGSVFCVVLLALIGGSYLIQKKIHADVQTQVDVATTETNAKNQSQLSNVKEQNTQLQAANKALTAEIETLREGSKLDEATILAWEEKSLHLSLLLEAVSHYQQGYTSKARETFANILPDVLPENCKEIYTYYEKRLK